MVMNALSLSVRGKEPVCRTKCVFTLDFVDVNLDFTGTSVKPVVLMNFGGRIVVSFAPVTLMGSVTQLRVSARACLTAGATCAKTAANVHVMGNVTLSTATATVRRAGGRPLAPKPVSATPQHPPVTKPRAAACVMRATGAKSAACNATVLCPPACSAQGPVSAFVAGGVRPVTAVVIVISAIPTVTCKLAPVCATRVTKALSAMNLVRVESTAEAVRRAVDTVKEAGLALNRTACVMPVHQGGMALAVTRAVLQVIMAIAAKRCDKPCTNGTYGDGCHFLCKTCYHGHCDHVTGSCICLPGFQGESCNSSCPLNLYGVNCSSTCDCGNHACHPATGACPNSSRAGLIAGLLIPLCILILALLFCCCCCGRPVEGKEGVAVEDVSLTVRMKHHVYTVLANMGAAMPCITLWSSGLPRVTVSHHDPELTFNHSFIEQPSSGWVTDSFETDDEGEAIYCEPPREDVLTVAGGELQELNSKCNFFPDPSTFSSEDMSQDFGIPRTSSIAKSKRPSVSFAEGTKFTSKERRSSTQDLPGTTRKPKAWGVLMISALQGGQGNHSEIETEKEEKNNEESISSEEQAAASETSQSDSARYGSGPLRTHLTVPGGRRRTLSNTRKNTQPSDGSHSDADSEKLTTVYVTVGKTQKMAKQEPPSEGPVQAMLRRLGSLQRQKEEAALPKGRGQAIAKPPRKKLGARASAWEQTSGSGQSEVVMRKPSRRQHSSLSSPCTVGATDFPQENSTPKRPLSSVLKSVPESETLHSLEVEQDTEVDCETDALTEHAYETVAPSDGVTSSEIIINETVMDQSENEPCYENVYVNHS
ncbi:scavenger receptor class F member 1 isoform X2 [Pimephales promelas]|uniref:scavenger receptor class F member 1 isoform X2 n=1 Tax=Pimephales promelas TaxID=90988 RepID=UPI0019557E29|nr:scavenger receptor class F member 1 isoform X2 [Pimephales promelas]